MSRWELLLTAAEACLLYVPKRATCHKFKQQVDSCSSQIAFISCARVTTMKSRKTDWSRVQRVVVLKKNTSDWGSIASITCMKWTGKFWQVKKLRYTKAGSTFTLLLRDHNEHAYFHQYSIQLNHTMLGFQIPPFWGNKCSQVSREREGWESSLWIQVSTLFPSNHLYVHPHKETSKETFLGVMWFEHKQTCRSLEKGWTDPLSKLKRSYDTFAVLDPRPPHTLCTFTYWRLVWPLQESSM